MLSGTSLPNDQQHRLVWCPFVPQLTQEKNEKNLIVGVSHGDQVNVYSVRRMYM